ncbi:TetR/AcrR family transcriptional regulator [uncultured Cohaesibacter sp.]|uniref:TetR/AcrR family transcriptional regulator n=1 Tax=uncultured Cohaesibacter sp. TaxID=1002546 RepID=UPI0029317DA8|nr:TetR/AcrR family transcriptional regulator [uncultured Cohaesibacter sp.]
MNLDEILLIFCQYGFRKASMDDIARAAGLSRQSIYKKFGSKQGIFEWTLAELTARTFKSAMMALDDAEATVSDRIANAFDRWAGEYVPLLSGTPHGAEMFERAMEFYSKDGHEGEDEFYSAVEALMLDAGMAKTPQDAADKVYTLAVSAKGLLLRCRTKQAFHDDMIRILKAII